MGFGLRNRTLSSNMAGVVVPVAESSSSRRINIIISGIYRCEADVCFRIKIDTPLRKLINAYCELKNLHYDSSTIYFIYNRTHIKPENTSQELGIEDGSEIHVMMIQTGGGYGRSHKM
ncbi:hypothetical protein MKW94_000139 [Papaver nudicaule]|uniref:Ubiquitin-like domain-containing protein n=1 Tax=Papaver nudicaule TaxID=74823 RepID=A0AA41S4J8_PAPNU|nr:hypothetical protein [Papaver nudicaule]